MNNLNICYIITSMGYGGAEKLLVNSVNELVKNKICIHIIYLKPIDNLLIELDEKITTQYLSFKTVGFGKKLKRIIRNLKPDVIHTHLGHADLLCHFYLRNFKTKKYCTLHNVFYKWNYLDNVIFLAYKLLFKIISRKVNIIAISRAVKEHAIKNYAIPANRVFYIPNSIPDYTLDIDKFSARKKLSIKENIFTFIFVGRLSVQKSVHTLIEATKLLASKLNNFEVLIIGEGELKKDLIALSNNLATDSKVKFIGTSSEVDVYLKACDGFILPSVFEGLPTVILEAFRAKIPVIASNVDGNNDLIEDKITGLLFEVSSAKELAEKMYELRINNNQQDLTRNAFNEFKSKFTLSNYVNSHINLYNN